MSNGTLPDGPIWLRDPLSKEDLVSLDEFCDQDSVGRRLDHGRFADFNSLRHAVESVVPSARPVHAVGFDKSHTRNWGVPWHQDRVIAVAARHDKAGYTNWSEEAVFWHCEPPAELLRRMFFLRVFLDDTNEENGGMRFASGSQKEGIVPASHAEKVAKSYPSEAKTATRGDLLFLPMLTPHGSKPA